MNGRSPPGLTRGQHFSEKFYSSYPKLLELNPYLCRPFPTEGGMVIGVTLETGLLLSNHIQNPAFAKAMADKSEKKIKQ